MSLVLERARPSEIGSISDTSKEPSKEQSGLRPPTQQPHQRKSYTLGEIINRTIGDLLHDVPTIDYVTARRQMNRAAKEIGFTDHTAAIGDPDRPTKRLADLLLKLYVTECTLVEENRMAWNR